MTGRVTWIFGPDGPQPLRTRVAHPVRYPGAGPQCDVAEVIASTARIGYIGCGDDERAELRNPDAVADAVFKYLRDNGLLREGT